MLLLPQGLITFRKNIERKVMNDSEDPQQQPDDLNEQPETQMSKVGLSVAQQASHSEHSSSQHIQSINEPPKTNNFEEKPSQRRVLFSKKANKIPVQVIHRRSTKRVGQKENDGKAKTQTKKECRICLEDESEGRIIQPCICSGSISYIHERCLKEWIKRKQDPRFPKMRVACELCQTPMIYKIAKSRSLDFEAFRANYDKEKSNYFLFCFFAILLLSGAVFLSAAVALSKGSSPTAIKIRGTLVKNENMRVIFICLAFILSILLMFLVILFIIQYGFRTELVITDLRNYSDLAKMRTSPRIKRIYPRAVERRRSNTSSELESSDAYQ